MSRIVISLSWKKVTNRDFLFVVRNGPYAKKQKLGRCYVFAEDEHIIFGYIFHMICRCIVVVHYFRRPRWLGRLCSCIPKSISRAQFAPSAHTRRDFFLHQKLISGKRESVS